MKMNKNLFTIEQNLSAVAEAIHGIRNYAQQCRIADDTLHGVCEGLPFVNDELKPYMDPTTMAMLVNWEPYKLVCTMKKVHEMLIEYHVDSSTIKKVMKQMMDHNRIIDPYYLIYIDDDFAPGFYFFQVYSRPEAYVEAYNKAHPGQYQVGFTEVDDDPNVAAGGLMFPQKKHIMKMEDLNLILQWVFSLKGTPYNPYINYQCAVKLEITELTQSGGEWMAQIVDA